jgi:predicted transcriptional regulator
VDVVKLCRRSAVTIRPHEEILAAAKLMREQHVGYLVVVEPVLGDEGVRTVGVLTDRDIVVRVLAREVDPCTLRVGDVMTRDPVVAQATDRLDDALRSMRLIGVRRIPVAGHRGLLVGVLSLDEIIDELACRLSDVAGSIRTEQRAEEVLRP